MRRARWGEVPDRQRWRDEKTSPATAAALISGCAGATLARYTEMIEMFVAVPR
jgi:hypothetical protein